MANWEHFLRGVIPHEIDFNSFIEEITGTNAIFLGDYHSESAPHSKNQKKIIEKIIKIPDVFLGLEYSCETLIESYHKPLIEASRNSGKEPIFLEPQNGNPEFWRDYEKREAYALEKIKKGISEGKKLVIIFGENHIRPGEKFCAGIPYLLNGRTTAAIVYQDILKEYGEGIFKLEKRIPGKMIYNINREII